MGEVVTYANNNRMCFCQIKFESGERILISIAAGPTPSVMVTKLGLLGLFPKQTIWEYNPTMAGGYDAYVRNLMKMFHPLFAEGSDHMPSSSGHPLDILRDLLLPCHSIAEARDLLFAAERRASGASAERDT